MNNQLSQWFAVALLMVGLGIIAGYWLVPGSPKLASFDKVSIDFPTIAFNQFGSQELTVRNVSNKRVQLAAHAECRCTNVVPSTVELMPGQSLELKVHYRPKLVANEIFSIEESLIRFESFNGQKVELTVIPLRAEVLKPILVEALPLTVAQFGTNSVDVSWPVSLMNEVESIEILKLPQFMEQLKVEQSNKSTDEKVLHGATRTRFEISENKGDVFLAAKTRTGKSFQFSLPTPVTFEEVFQLNADSIHLLPGQVFQLKLKQLDPERHSCIITQAECDVSGVEIRSSQNVGWELIGKPGEANTGFVKVQVCTQELISKRKLFTDQYIPVFVN